MYKLIKGYTNNPDYIQEDQVYDCKFAYGKVDWDKKEVTVLHKPVLCRDFLLDTLVWHVKPKEGSIYRYDYDGPIERGFTCLAVKKLANAKKNLGFLNTYEISVGMEPSYLLDCGRNNYVIIGDKRWMDNTVRMSAYTWMIRNFLYPEIPKTDCDRFGKRIFDVSLLTKIVNAKSEYIWNYKPLDNEFAESESWHGCNGFIYALDFPKWSHYAIS